MIILINALGIYEGGGLNYLRILKKRFDKINAIIFLDQRLKNVYLPLSKAKVIYSSSTIFGRLYFSIYRLRLYINQSLDPISYRGDTNINEFYLNGLPPLLRYKSKMSRINLFFQNRLIFNSSIDYLFDIRFRAKFYLIRLIIKLTYQPSDLMIVQTKSMQESVNLFFKKNKVTVKVESSDWKNFFNNKSNSNDSSHKSDLILKEIKRLPESYHSKLITFIYPASDLPHKNHKRLFKAFKQISINTNYKFLLYVTISNKSAIALGADIPQIIPVGNLSNDLLLEYYSQVNFLVFPSLLESLGLPLLEASSIELPVIASDLDYVYEVCKPISTFNPNSELSMLNSIVECINKTINVN